MKKSLPLIFPYLLYLVVIIAFLFPVLFVSDSELVFGEDIHRAYYFFRQFMRHAVEEKTLPFWNPFSFSGTPYLANPIVNFFYPLNWLYIVLPLSYAFPLHIGFHLFVAMSGTYWFLKKYLNEAPSFVGGLLFGMSGFFVSRIYAGHVDVIASASYIPFVFGSIITALKDSKNGHVHHSVLLNKQPHILRYIEYIISKPTIHASVIVSIQLYAGYPTMAFFTILASGIGVLVYSLIRRSFIPVLRFFIIGIIAGGLSAFQLFPMQEFISYSIRSYEFPYSWISYGSNTIQSLISIFFPFPFGNHISYYGPPPNYWEHASYMGMLAILLLIIAIVMSIVRFIKHLINRLQKHAKTDQEVVLPLILLIILMCSLWISLGPNAPIFDLQKFVWEYIPLYARLRFPSRHMVLFVFSAGALAAFGFEYLILSIRRINIRIILSGIVVSFVIAELFQHGIHFLETKQIPELRHDTTIVNLVRGNREEVNEIWKTPLSFFRTLPNFGVWVDPRDKLDFDSSMSYRWFSVTGYDPSILRNYYEFIDAVNGTYKPSILTYDVQVPYVAGYSPYVDFLNVKYVIVPVGYDPYGGVNTEVYKIVQKTDTYILYEHTRPFDRFFLVPNKETLPTREDVVKRIGSWKNDPSKTVLFARTDNKNVSSSTADTACGSLSGSARIISYTLNNISIHVNAPCDMYLVSSEVYYPGWKASIDGKNTDIYEGNLAFRTIAVPKGEHRVEYWYAPSIWIIGFIISVITVGAIILLEYMFRRSRIVA